MGKKQLPTKIKQVPKTKLILKGTKSTYFQDQLNLDLLLPVFVPSESFKFPTFYIPEQEKQFHRKAISFMRLEKFIKEKKDSQPMFLYEYGPEIKGLLFCSVCKFFCTDYFQHIDSQIHNRCINDTKYTKYLWEIQEKYRIVRKKSQKESKLLKEINEELSTHEIDEEQNSNEQMAI